MKKQELKKKLIIKKVKAALIVVITALLVNTILSNLTGFNLIGTALKNVVNLFNNSYTEEVKSVTIDSDDYKTKTGGSFHIDKSGEWTGTASAKVHFDVDTVMKVSSTPKDVIFVLDISGSMDGEKLNRVKEDSKELVENLLSDQQNKVALITFDSDAAIVSQFTNNKNSVVSLIENLSTKGSTNYNQALLKVDELLENYEVRDNRGVIVLFLTDGYPNEETHNEIAEYETLKGKYPYLTINAIQYEMGTQIVQDIINISDDQFHADMETLNNILFDASLNPEFYEKFEIVDWIANDYFEVENEEDIKVSLGSVKLENVDGKQKITWTVPANTLRTGSGMTMDIDLKLKEQYVKSEGYYPTNEKEEIITKLFETDEKKKDSNDVPVLKSGYLVHYEANYPKSCQTKKYSKEETHYAFESVKISEDVPPTCDGYIFKGWGLASDAKKINDDYFQMPTNDVYLKGQWTNLSIAKSMDGTVHENLTLYKVVQKNGKAYSGEGPTDTTDTVYFANTQDNNVLFANTCWKIVRTTETGGVKLLYNGVPSESNGKKVCTNSGTSQQLDTKSAYNSNYNSPAYVGYMYNTIYTYHSGTPTSSAIFGNDVTYDAGQYTLTDTSTTKDNTHHYTCNSSSSETCSTVRYYYYNNYYIELKDGKKVENALDEMLFDDDVNTNDSDIKKVVDGWYEENISGKYETMLEDTVFCNDRSIETKNGWDKDGNISGYLYFHAYSKYDLTCKNKNDRFTVSESIGNGKLKYPVGLLTAGEANIAGSSMMKTGEYYWLLSPYIFNDNVAYVGYVTASGGLGGSSVGNSYGVRPVVSLIPDVEYSEGDGTANNPYVIIETD